MSELEEREPCPTCDRDLWYVGHVCYTYADLAAYRAQYAFDRAEPS